MRRTAHRPSTRARTCGSRRCRPVQRDTGRFHRTSRARRACTQGGSRRTRGSSRSRRTRTRCPGRSSGRSRTRMLERRCRSRRRRVHQGSRRAWSTGRGSRPSTSSGPWSRSGRRLRRPRLRRRRRRRTPCRRTRRAAQRGTGRRPSANKLEPCGDLRCFLGREQAAIPRAEADRGSARHAPRRGASLRAAPAGVEGVPG